MAQYFTQKSCLIGGINCCILKETKRRRGKQNQNSLLFILYSIRCLLFFGSVFEELVRYYWIRMDVLRIWLYFSFFFIPFILKQMKGKEENAKKNPMPCMGTELMFTDFAFLYRFFFSLVLPHHLLLGGVCIWKSWLCVNIIFTLTFWSVLPEGGKLIDKSFKNSSHVSYVAWTDRFQKCRYLFILELVLPYANSFIYRTRNTCDCRNGIIKTKFYFVTDPIDWLKKCMHLNAHTNTSERTGHARRNSSIVASK